MTKIPRVPPAELKYLKDPDAQKTALEILVAERKNGV